MFCRVSISENSISNSMVIPSDPLPKDKISDLFKLKTFADNTLNVTQKLKFLLGRVENKVGGGGGGGIKTGDCW